MSRLLTNYSGTSSVANMTHRPTTEIHLKKEPNFCSKAQ